MQDTFTWHVEYKSGEILQECDETGSPGRGFAEVDQAQVKTVILSLPTLPTQPLHHVSVPDGASPVFFRRRKITLNTNSCEQTHMTVHCIGWRKDDQEVYLFVCDDGSTLLSNALNAI